MVGIRGTANMNGRAASANCKLDGAPRALPAVERQLHGARVRASWGISGWRGNERIGLSTGPKTTAGTTSGLVVQAAFDGIGESLSSPLVVPRSAIRQILKRERRRPLRDGAFLPSHAPEPACRGGRASARWSAPDRLERPCRFIPLHRVGPCTNDMHNPTRRPNDYGSAARRRCHLDHWGCHHRPARRFRRPGPACTEYRRCLDTGRSVHVGRANDSQSICAKGCGSRCLSGHGLRRRAGGPYTDLHLRNGRWTADATKLERVVAGWLCWLGRERRWFHVLESWRDANRPEDGGIFWQFVPSFRCG